MVWWISIWVCWVLWWLRLGGRVWCLKAHIWDYQGYDIPNISNMLKINNKVQTLTTCPEITTPDFVVVIFYGKQNGSTCQQKKRSKTLRWKDRLDAKAGKYHVWYGFAVGIFAQDCEAHWLWHLSGNWSWRKGVTLYAVVGGISSTNLLGRADQISMMIWENHFIALRFLFREWYVASPASYWPFFITSWNYSFVLFLFFPTLFLLGSFGIDIVSPQYSLRNLEICNLPSLKLTALRTWKWMVGILFSPAYILSGTWMVGRLSRFRFGGTLFTAHSQGGKLPEVKSGRHKRRRVAGSWARWESQGTSVLKEELFCSLLQRYDGYSLGGGFKYVFKCSPLLPFWLRWILFPFFLGCIFFDIVLDLSAAQEKKTRNKTIHW